MRESHGQLTEAFLAGQKLPVFVDISPDSSAANTGKLLSMLEWLRPLASRIVVVEGGFLARWDLMALNGLSELEATNKASRRADTAAKRIGAVIRQLRSPEKYHFLDWRTILAHKDFQVTRSGLYDYLHQSVQFATEVRQTADDFHKRLSRRGCILRCPDPLACFSEYVLEEIAVFIYLCTHQSLLVEVYAGADLAIMRHIAESHFERFPFPIPQRTHVSVDVLPSALRLARPQDWQAICAIVREWPTHFVTAAISKIEADFRNAPTIIWEEDRRLLGFAVWDTNGSEIELKWLAVSPKVTRRRIGAALVNAVIAAADTETRVFLLTATTDSVIPGTPFDAAAYRGTHAFFKTMGFRATGVHKCYWGPANHALVMEKLL